jgi:hypothetical protein
MKVILDIDGWRRNFNIPKACIDGKFLRIDYTALKIHPLDITMTEYIHLAAKTGSIELFTATFKEIICKPVPVFKLVKWEGGLNDKRNLKRSK